MRAAYGEWLKDMLGVGVVARSGGLFISEHFALCLAFGRHSTIY